VHAGEQQALAVALALSPDTRLEITSDPPRALIWLDGHPCGARTACKRHALRGEPALAGRSPARAAHGHGTWRRDVDVEPDRTTQVHGVLAPARPQGRR
jgi:hypothetical protein